MEPPGYMDPRYDLASGVAGAGGLAAGTNTGRRLAVCNQIGYNKQGELRLPERSINPNRYSIRVTRQYRISFEWNGKDAEDVRFEDYH